MNSSEPHPRWKDLLQWLATHGMDITPDRLRVEARTTPAADFGLFALQSTPPSTPLFTIPANVLLNISTLSPHYPRSSLTAIQLISLHLLCFRPLGSQLSVDPLFGPYISILPRHFKSHPLTWLWNKKHSVSGVPSENQLLDSLPSGITYRLVQLSDRFQSDWKSVRAFLYEHPNVLLHSRGVSSIPGEELLESDYLWAWLNVNTRCVYYRLKLSPSDSDNITLCPILDFANHTTELTHMSLPSTPKMPYNKTGGDFTLLAPSDGITLSNDELFLTYGAHSNSTLFAEYGFINQPHEDEYYRGEADVQAIVENLFAERGKLGAWMKQQLVGRGYWGDWTLHASPLPAHPSYRLITALRLYHLFPISSNNAPLDLDDLDIVHSWYDVLLGNQDFISDENEDAWRGTLLQICQDLVNLAMPAISRCYKRGEGDQGWIRVMERNIKMLWEEELTVAKLVSKSVIEGIQF